VGQRQVTGTRRIIERYLAALNAHDADAAAACVAADFCNEHTSALGHTVRGRDAYRARLPEFLARFADLHYEPEDWIVDGDRAAVPYRMTCLVVDGAERHSVAIRGMFRFRVEHDEIIHRVDYWDGSEFTRQTTQTERAS
jgi:limonene-1,2-epoxide hydrolase